MSEVISPVTGIRIFRDIVSATGVDTLEGKIGPLVSAERGACHFIDMPPGIYCDAHAHPTESLIYTVRGQWVLCAGGERFHMRAGDVFWFGDNVATGYEVPFDESAYLLIFKTAPRDSDDAFIEYLQGMAQRLETDNANGTPFRFSELAEDHPAKVFARSLG